MKTHHYKTNHYATGTTITGRRVRIYDIQTTDDYPLIGAVEEELNRWRITRWTLNGHYYKYREHINDLVDAPALAQKLTSLHAGKIPLVCFDQQQNPFFIYATNVPGTYAIHAGSACRTGLNQMFTLTGRYSEIKTSADDLIINDQLQTIINNMS